MSKNKDVSGVMPPFNPHSKNKVLRKSKRKRPEVENSPFENNEEANFNTEIFEEYEPIKDDFIDEFFSEQLNNGDTDVHALADLYGIPHDLADSIASMDLDAAVLFCNLLQELNDKLDESTRHSAEINHENKRLTTSLRKKTKEIESLKEKLKQAKQEIKTLKSVVGKFEKQVAKLENK